MNESIINETINNIFSLIGSPNQLKVMIGAKDFCKGMYGEKYNCPGISFKFKMSKQYNFCKISLNPLDLYDLELGKIRKFEYTNQVILDNIYFDNLRSIFSDKTGLSLSCPIISRNT